MNLLEPREIIKLKCSYNILNDILETNNSQLHNLFTRRDKTSNYAEASYGNLQQLFITQINIKILIVIDQIKIVEILRIVFETRNKIQIFALRKKSFGKTSYSN